MMDKFELCFPIIDTQTYLIPELLKSEPIKLEKGWQFYALNTIMIFYRIAYFHVLLCVTIIYF